MNEQTDKNNSQENIQPAETPADTLKIVCDSEETLQSLFEAFRAAGIECGNTGPQHGWSRNPEVVKQMQDKQGISLRDKLAESAMREMIAMGNPFRDPDILDIASRSYRMADAMLAARKEAK